MDAEDLADVAESVFGAERVTIAPQLDEAIEVAVGLADEADAGSATAAGRARRRSSSPARSSRPARPACCWRPAARGRPSPRRRPRQPITKRLCMTVLIMEAIVIGLVIPVAIQIDHLAPGSAGAAAAWPSSPR